MMEQGMQKQRPGGSSSGMGIPPMSARGVLPLFGYFTGETPATLTAKMAVQTGC
jgi:hypothetical protein